MYIIGGISSDWTCIYNQTMYITQWTLWTLSTGKTLTAEVDQPGYPGLTSYPYLSHKL